MVDADEPGIVARLRAAGCVFAEDEAAILLGATDDAQELETLVQRRIAGEPLEVVVGWAAFCGIRVVVEPGVFVPRRRTALLVDRAAMIARPGAVVVDLCCGTGAIGAALAARIPGARVFAADADPAAVHCARRNLPADRVFAGDLFTALPPNVMARVDLLVVNAPYVPTAAIALMPPEARDHEPRIALDGGDDGLALHRRIALEAGAWLAPGGTLLIETSAVQADRTATLFRAAGLRVSVARDEDLDATAVLATRP